MKKVRELSDTEKEKIKYKAGAEGFDYYIQNYAEADFSDTEQQERLSNLRKELDWFESLVDDFPGELG